MADFFLFTLYHASATIQSDSLRKSWCQIKNPVRMNTNPGLNNNVTPPEKKSYTKQYFFVP